MSNDSKEAVFGSDFPKTDIKRMISQQQSSTIATGSLAHSDGTLSKVTGFGSVAVTKDLVLKSVLFVPKLNCNLLSVNKLTQEQQCTANFSPYACIFQESDPGRTIGSAKALSGLYFLKAKSYVKKQSDPTACGAGCEVSSSYQSLLSRSSDDR
ncbi:hypothetical protein LWI28_015611 [Acer negundo]|uniref:Retrovirus-related Pol polyprotein from transposon TNT 1-94-like beta-barrel domain-containing protein n=1 Tax=Acer negundo TaxID=4023 RepID=A0AAD5J0F1_ACENE|nr:hypothetical protein LWI28_015611 [Acer negundo]